MREQTDHANPIRLSSPRAGGGVFTKLMMIPGVQLIYVSALACTRHRSIDFIQMQRAGRLSFLLFSEVDMITGDYITKTKEAAAEIAAERSPTGIILLTGCQSALLSTDYNLLSEEIEQETGVPVRVHDGCRLCGFDEEEGGASAVDRLLYAFIRPAAKSEELSVNILGSAALDENSELFSILNAAGVKKINRLAACKSFDEYQEMGRAHLNILTSPQDAAIGEYLQETFGIPWVCLGGIYDSAELAASYRKLAEALGSPIDTSAWEDRLADKLRTVKEKIGARPITVEGDAEMAKWLLNAGFSVESLALNPHQGLTREQRVWFEENAKDFRIEGSGKGGPGGGKPGGPGGGKPGGPGGGRPGGPGGGGRPGGGRPQDSGAKGPELLPIGYAGSLAVLKSLENSLGGAAR
ncbi:MAG: nitrogenase component 1 [Oscillospiraceae bacterium]